ncbi:hypothetical protein GCM10022221_57860 [Actinocorallia aurea]
MFGERFRRDALWKFRAVGQGYASGLAGLAADFGIAVQSDEPADQADGAPAGHEAPPQAAPADEAPPAAERPVRTGRRPSKKCTLSPAKTDLADHPHWRQARLFSVDGLRNDQEREVRATSTLLSVGAGPRVRPPPHRALRRPRGTAPRSPRRSSSTARRPCVRTGSCGCRARAGSGPRSSRPTRAATR